jgi:hypothetical protein
LKAGILDIKVEKQSHYNKDGKSISNAPSNRVQTSI